MSALNRNAVKLALPALFEVRAHPRQLRAQTAATRGSDRSPPHRI